MAYKKIYKITVKADDEKQMPTEDEIELILNEVPADFEYHIDAEEVMDCENCMCAIINDGKVYCNFFHFSVSGNGCNWWIKNQN